MELSKKIEIGVTLAFLPVIAIGFVAGLFWLALRRGIILAFSLGAK